MDCIRLGKAVIVLNACHRARWPDSSICSKNGDGDLAIERPNNVLDHSVSEGARQNGREIADARLESLATAKVADWTFASMVIGLMILTRILRLAIQ
jgi:hypothetical protein